MHETTVMRRLPCKLTREEINDYGRQNANKVQEKLTAVEAQKSAAQHHKAIVAELDSEIVRLSSAINTGIEDREVECEQTPDYDAGKMRVTRTDTGEIIDTRPLRAEEWQSKMRLVE